MDEFRKSIKSILYERTTSPFYGTFLFSWVVWNWKILYVTFFISEKTIGTDKLSFMLKHHLFDNFNLMLWPFISTVLLLTLVPFLANGAFWLKLKFDKWKKDKRNEVELKRLLTLEQSIELRESLLEQEQRFIKLLEEKDLRIEQLELKQSSSTFNKPQEMLGSKGFDEICSILNDDIQEVEFYYPDLLRFGLDSKGVLKIKEILLKCIDLFEKNQNSLDLEKYQQNIFRLGHVLIKNAPNQIFADFELRKSFLKYNSWFIMNITANQKEKFIYAFIEYLKGSDIFDSNDIVLSMLSLMEGDREMNLKYSNYIMDLKNAIGNEKVLLLLKNEKLKKLNNYNKLISILEN